MDTVIRFPGGEVWRVLNLPDNILVRNGCLPGRFYFLGLEDSGELVYLFCPGGHQIIPDGTVITLST